MSYCTTPILVQIPDPNARQRNPRTSSNNRSINGVVGVKQANASVTSRSVGNFTPLNRDIRNELNHTAVTLQRDNGAGSSGNRVGASNNANAIVTIRSLDDETSNAGNRNLTPNGQIDYNPIQSFNQKLYQFVNPTGRAFVPNYKSLGYLPYPYYRGIVPPYLYGYPGQCDPYIDCAIRYGNYSDCYNCVINQGGRTDCAVQICNPYNRYY